MNVLVTGGSGFVGSNLRKRKPEWFYPTRQQYDLLDRDQVFDAIDENQPDVVVHLAATVGGIQANKDNPGKFFYDNMHMGMNIIDVCNYFKTKLVILGTCCSYPRNCPIPFKESSLWNGFPEETNAPYGIAKRTLLTMCEAYRDSYDFKYIGLIPTNMYGPADNKDAVTSHVIPAIIQKIGIALHNKADVVKLWGTGQASRDFLYVDDCVDAIITAVESDYVGYMNLGTEIEVKIMEVAQIIGNLMDYKGNFVFEHSKPDGQPRRCVSFEKAKAVLGWYPKTNLTAGLQRTINDIYPNFLSQ